MNRLEEKLGRECTDHDYDVQQILLERAQKRIRELEMQIWAIARSAPDRRVSFYRGYLIDAPEGVLHTWENVADMTVVIEARSSRDALSHQPEA